MRLLVLGASGGCGHWLVRYATEVGHEVVAVVRPGSSVDAPDEVRLITGDPVDPKTLDAAMPGVDAVISCLGLRRAGRSPWSKLVSPPDLTQRAIAALLAAMKRHGVHRIIVTSAAGVGDSVQYLSKAMRWLTSRGNIGVAYKDLTEMERLLEDSDVDWLAVRPVTLTDGPPTGRVGMTCCYGIPSMVRRADVARYMLEALGRNEPLGRRAVMLGAN